MQELKAIAKTFINLFYPLHCLACNEQLGALDDLRLCSHCIGSIKLNAMPPLELEAPGVMAYSACLFEGTLKELVHKFKYRAKTSLTGILANLMIDHIKNNPELAEVDIMTTVPLHKSRLREREFNQSILLANKISKEFGIPVRHTLEKVIKTRYQNELTKSERLVNLKNAFGISGKDAINGKRILLIDDVMTTGATLSECANTLLSGGAGRVTALTLARGI